MIVTGGNQCVALTGKIIEYRRYEEGHFFYAYMYDIL